MGLRDFKGYHVDFLTLGFKVWEHPNLNVSTLTLKDQFLKNWYYFCCLIRSKMPTKSCEK